ncbi:hypothetical protein [Nonomuraea rubra]|uniref:HEAT repeat domain-containing protein n=1 Tax=Nonomuraea rubra TaxID=46180 RepID=A0A7X0P5B0_9ACTN|nr:hypothetical protein [Nonomuraea rubra]MBB6555536.1 hypothetical protein [Nonomuraea rubra]
MIDEGDFRSDGHESPPDEPIMDSIHRLIADTSRGRPAAGELTAALFAVATDAALARKAMDVLAATPTIWLDVDLAARRRHPPLTLHDLARHEHLPPYAGPLLALALAACVWNGRERERVVGHPLMRTEPVLLPVLLIRTADWVRAVRERALKALAGALANADLMALLTAVPMAVRLARRTRATPALDLVRAALLRADDGTLNALLRTDQVTLQDPQARRFVYDVLLQAGRLDHAMLTRAALHEPDQLARTRCARTLASQAVEHARPELAAAILDGASAQGRVQALTALVRLGHTEHGPRHLDDNAGMVRLTAQWAVRRAGGDPAALYRARLATGGDPESRQVTRGLLAGLGDCGTRDDAALVLPYLRHPRPRVRAERPRHVRQAAHRLLAARDAWSRVKADLLLLRDPDEKLRARARGDLTIWCRTDSVTAYPRACPPEVRTELEALIHAAGPLLGTESARLLRLSLQLSR